MKQFDTTVYNFVAAVTGLLLAPTALVAQSDATLANNVQTPMENTAPPAQAVEPAPGNGTLSVTAYADAFYGAFTGNYAPGETVEFESISSRANEINLNSLGVNVSYEGNRIRANAEVFTGVVREDAWGGDFVKNANVGFEVAKDLWVDAGFFSTYAGVESALPGDNVFSSVAISTYQEPYRHAAFKAGYSGVKDWDFELWLGNAFNGYRDNNSVKTLSAVARYSINDNTSISYTGTYGIETNESDRVGLEGQGLDDSWVLYNNVNLLTSPTEQLEVILNASLATVTNPNGDAVGGLNGMATVRYLVSDKFAVAARGSFLGGGDSNFYGVGKSANDIGLSLQLLPTDASYVRLEGRTIGTQDDTFFTDNNGDPIGRRFDLVLSAGIKLGKDWALK